MDLLIKLSSNDFKLIFRDASLRIFLALPILIFLVIYYLIPFLIGKYPAVKEYLPYIFMAAAIQIVQMFGFIYAMVFIDEKDTQVAKVYGVLPVNKNSFILSRLVIPVIISAIVTALLLFIQPFYDFNLPQQTGIVILIGGLCIIYPLVVSVLSGNKMEGMTWIKGINIIVIIPLIAYFVPADYTLLFGIFPSFWIFEFIRIAIEGNFSLLHLSVGMVYLFIIIFVMLNRFTSSHFN